MGIKLKKCVSKNMGRSSL